ncbi:MAG: Fe-S protein assembly co-chaperone HscB [Candidatus Korobacteraceae bacterium]|jgi:molecular chaperone HscB
MRKDADLSDLTNTGVKAAPAAKGHLQVIQGRPHPHRCWSCGDMRAEHFCGECGHVQPAEPTDFFSFFGLPRRLELDEAALESEFYALNRKLHPDVYSRASAREQQWSLEKTSQLNDAYRTLKDPISRTEYLLMLEGIQLEEQSKIATEQARAFGREKKQMVPAELLEEAFELNMLLEEAKLGGVDDNLRGQLNGTRVELTARLDAMQDELRAAWKKWDDGESEATATMVDVLNRRSYLSNLVRYINEVLN